MAERIDRQVFEDLWADGSFRMRAFLRVLYRPCYPHWPEFAEQH